MSNREIMEAILVGVIMAMVIFAIIFNMKKGNEPIGTIVVYDNGTSYEWHFEFEDGVTYDAIANMDRATFKIKKGDKTNDIHGSDGNNSQGK